LEKGSSGEAMVLEPSDPTRLGEAIQPVDEEKEHFLKLNSF
jgi:hypothetical protein